MSVLQVCPPCRDGDCHRCIPQDPPRDKHGLLMGTVFIGGTSCPCRHTDEDRAEWKRQDDAAYRHMFGETPCDGRGAHKICPPDMCIALED